MWLNCQEGGDIEIESQLFYRVSRISSQYALSKGQNNWNIQRGDIKEESACRGAFREIDLS